MYIKAQNKSATVSTMNKNDRLATTQEPNGTELSVFDLSKRHRITFDSGKIIPLYKKLVVPSDIFTIDIDTQIRMSTPAASVMENAKYEIYTFFIPFDIIWPDFKYFFGESKQAGFTKVYDHVPLMVYDKPLKYTENDMGSYLGIPINKDMSKVNVPINALYFRAAAKVYNDWFRDENLQDEINEDNNNKINDDVRVSEYLDSTGAPVDINLSYQIGKGLLNAAKLNNYFSTALPWPQKGTPVDIGNVALQQLFIRNTSHPKTLDLFSPTIYNKSGTRIVKGRINASGSGIGVDQGDVSPHVNDVGYLSLEVGTSGIDGMLPVTDLRKALIAQHVMERNARAGTRMVEQIRSMYGIFTSDSVLYRSEMIGYTAGFINVDTIVQSSASTTNSPLGTTSGVSFTNGSSSNMTSYAVKKHGVIMSFIVVRPELTYSQGLDRDFTVVEKLDFHEPLANHIGEQPVYNYEIFLSDKDNNKNNDVFAWQPMYEYMRWDKNTAAGYISANSELSIASLYTYQEVYDDTPTYSKEFIQSKKDVIGKTLLINGGELEYLHQFIANFHIKVSAQRPLPIFGTAGLNRV